MDKGFYYRGDKKYVEDIALEQLAENYGTPLYVYSMQVLRDNFRAYHNALAKHSQEGLQHRICYAVKANSNLAILQFLAAEGSGFDIVSGGELSRVLAAGGDATKVLFSGVGKSAQEMAQALEAGIGCFNLESAMEAEVLGEVVTQVGKPAKVSVRINPDVSGAGHPHLATGLGDSKFGIEMSEAWELFQWLARDARFELLGVSCHIGSQILSLTPFAQALEGILPLLERLRPLVKGALHLNMGGGLGVHYRPEDEPPSIADYIDQLMTALKTADVILLVEPGRSLVAASGVLLTQVRYCKKAKYRDYAIVDGAMNDLMRPSLYDAYMPIEVVGNLTSVAQSKSSQRLCDVVGPVCESGDVLGIDRHLSVVTGDLLTVGSAGAYASSMSSNYNSRPRVAEVLVAGSQCYLIRERENVTDLFQHEKLLPTKALISKDTNS